ncbi:MULTISPECIES: TonB-dependent receptor plug domain-containing protein [Chryseobacterium]|uniref:Iron complex outermembrane receptor protein n=1 Tax=Chryseobacterium camelliae TaxID=1265445 RepID=A0ABU0TJQ8_9FLAO|nr:MULTISPECIES: TonB-dependent receptor [Chryseobacterium]MDT3408873.1 iron complex outermembrane receptor protein [Pseudacidovorax intermedius]MDQ1097270.1 iron complex outermembrane receptor protein [Chryseobacterium camelliae]MDQ1101204.1 iron complex outermembrane receptor protein [Chryseobacterium sp. SORGH_AS_1048]MDR6084650.1 iron complex outermembrane receptor protein [Chryseobacterium sp. SORGH_AS_0909]MDR6132922.1 iron complex outermembrane receptor protein [Chryseobacterium sp. SOR
MTNRKTILSASVVFFLGTFAYAQKNDSVKTGNVEEVVILGSRGGARSKADSPVPVDVFNLKEASVTLPQTNIAQILNAVAPSFTSTIQTNSDGTDHLDPAQLRGLGPDQVLVLVNEKRRHTSALVNVNGTPGRGTVGTDLNAIPSFAVSRIEVLRDGASAQYGSDAIAGVINLSLKRDTGKLTGQVSYGGNLTPAANDHTGDFDGQNIQVDLNYGNKIGKRGGFYNITWTSQFRDPTYRAGTESGSLYNAYNAVEQRALNNGVNLSSLFSNINTTPNTQQIINSIHQYAQQVDYFSAAFQSQIQAANSISALQGLLGQDFTNQELAYRGQSRKDFNMQVGQSKLNNHQLFLNMEVPLNDQWKVYTFGGYSLRHGTSGGFYRRPNQSRTFTGLYPNGYLPQIGTDIQDISLAAGVKGNWRGWNIDLSNTFGQNSFDYTIKNTGNTSMRFASPNEFRAGGLKFSQNTINLDFSKKYDVWNGINVAFGGEHRYENFTITAGEEASYATYDVNGNVWTGNSQRPTDFFGNPLTGGSQVFSGFRPANAVDKNRQSVAAYADVEMNFNRWLLVDAAARYENYSDFGSTFNYKLASRIKLDDNFNFRFAGSTGFRAPSIHQIYYNVTSTLFTNSQLLEVGTFSNDSAIAGLLGIPKLKQETSKSASVGFTYRIPSVNLSFTADGYFTRINNRIVLTDQFTKAIVPQKAKDAFDQAGVNAGQFFANAIDTETRGVDVVISHQKRFSDLRLDNNFAINLNQTRRVGNIHSSGLLQSANLENIYFSERSRVYLEEAVPRVKASLSHNLSWKGAEFYLRNTYFGAVTAADPVDVNGDGIIEFNEHQKIGDKIITDISAAYRFTKNIGLTVGVNNIFDIYPTKNLPASTNNDQFIYSRSTSQFGQNGRYVFTRLNFNF